MSFHQLYKTIVVRNLTKWGFDKEFAESMAQNVNSFEDVEEILEPYRPKAKYEPRQPLGDSTYREEIALKEELRHEALKNN